jgi:hypothetical protein
MVMRRRPTETKLRNCCEAAMVRCCSWGRETWDGVTSEGEVGRVRGVGPGRGPAPIDLHANRPPAAVSGRVPWRLEI